MRSIALDDRPFNRDEYLKEIPAIKQLEKQELVFDKRVSFLIGENGTGKSTLLEAIAVASHFNPEGGTKNFYFSTSNSHSELHEHLLLSKSAHERDGFFLRAESFYNVASYIDDLDKAGGFGPPIIDSYGGVSLHLQSHGESFLALVKNRFGGNGLYLLDEPEAALSPSRLMSLLIMINDIANANSQFIIATHSPILMSYPDADIFELDDIGIRKVEYKDTDHYKITKDFIERPDYMYRLLFESDKENDDR
ncbi:MAG: AAA family ATPase [Erysipelotrichaceae bacterium]|nr:AAA family ATPase [Erysipelotrichaceae bacterium]